MRLVLFSVLLTLFIFFLFIIVVKKEFRRLIFVELCALLLFGSIFLSLDGSKVFNLGFLKVSTQGENNQVKFGIKNPTNQNVKTVINLAASDDINNIKIDKGNNYITLIGGGEGNNYVTYNINIPPRELISGTLVSAGTSSISIVPQELKKEK